MIVEYKKILFKLMKNKVKPNFSLFTHKELIDICNEFIENICDDKNVQMDYLNLSLDTMNFIKNIITDNINIDINNNNIDKNALIDKLNNLWSNFPLLDNNNEPIDCIICFNHLTNLDNLIFKCSHLTHSSCFFNYLFSNLKNISSNTTINNNIENYFRCPKCRMYLTENIIANINTNANQNLTQDNFINVINNIDNNYRNNNDDDIDEFYGDEYNNIILQEYNLITNSLNNLMLRDNHLHRNIDYQNNINLDNSFNNIYTNYGINEYNSDTNSDTDTD